MVKVSSKAGDYITICNIMKYITVKVSEMLKKQGRHRETSLQILWLPGKQEVNIGKLIKTIGASWEH